MKAPVHRLSNASASRPLLGLIAILGPFLAPAWGDDPVDPDIPRPGAVGIGDPDFPELGAGGIDVLHYDLTLDVLSLYTGHVDAMARLDVKALHALTSFNLDFVGLEVLRVDVNGEEADFERDGRELDITPAETLANGEEFTVEIIYSGVPAPAPDPTHPGRGVGWKLTGSGVYVTSECMGAASWFPCNDHPRDKASFTMTVTVPKPYVVAANGILVDETDDGEYRTYSWETASQMATYLATVNIAEFDVKVEEGPHGMPMRTYFPKDFTEQEMKSFERQGEIVEFFEECFGPYPFASVGAIISYESLGGALETQTAPVYSRGMPEMVVAHELAHQWFGDHVSTRDWKHMWLNEGYATYAAHLWTEHALGYEAFEREMQNEYHLVHGARIGPPAFPPVEQLFSPRVYQRGSWTLHRLRLEVGDEAFFDIAQQWLVNNGNGTGVTEDFTALAEEISGQDLGAFFDAELYGEVTPVFPPYEEGSVDGPE